MVYVYSCSIWGYSGTFFTLYRRGSISEEYQRMKVENTVLLLVKYIGPCLVPVDTNMHLLMLILHYVSLKLV